MQRFQIKLHTNINRCVELVETDLADRVDCHAFFDGQLYSTRWLFSHYALIHAVRFLFRLDSSPGFNWLTLFLGLELFIKFQIKARLKSRWIKIQIEFNPCVWDCYRCPSMVVPVMILHLLGVGPKKDKASRYGDIKLTKKSLQVVIFTSASAILFQNIFSANENLSKNLSYYESLSTFTNAQPLPGVSNWQKWMKCQEWN